MFERSLSSLSFMTAEATKAERENESPAHYQHPWPLLWVYIAAKLNQRHGSYVEKGSEKIPYFSMTANIR